MEKLVFLQPVLAHYRESTFKIIQEWDDYEVHVISGSNYLNIKEFHPNNSTIFKYYKCKIGSHVFYFLHKSLRELLRIKPDIIISFGVDFHHLHTILIFIIHRLILRRRFYWWTHGVSDNQGKLGILVRKFFYKRATGVFSYSKKGKLELRRQGIPETNIQVLGNALNREDYGFLVNQLPAERKDVPFTIVFSGRINESRKLDILVKAISLLKSEEFIPFRVFLIGGGEVPGLKELVNDQALEEEVIFTGQIYGKEIANYLLKADLMVYPRYIGLAILQAFSYGLPVITSNNLENQMPEIELMSPGETGDFFEEDNVKELALKIKKWQKILSEHKATISEKCIQRIKDMEYFPEAVAQKIKAFLSNQN